MRRTVLQLSLISLLLVITIIISACGREPAGQKTAASQTATQLSSQTTCLMKTDQTAVESILKSLDDLGEATDGLDDITGSDLIVPE